MAAKLPSVRAKLISKKGADEIANEWIASIEKESDTLMILAKVSVLKKAIESMEGKLREMAIEKAKQVDDNAQQGKKFSWGGVEFQIRSSSKVDYSKDAMYANQDYKIEQLKTELDKNIKDTFADQLHEIALEEAKLKVRKDEIDGYVLLERTYTESIVVTLPKE